MGEWADLFGGLSPKVWLIVGTGFSREEVKTLLLDGGVSFTGRAISGLEELCLDLAQAQSDRMLGSYAREEVIRLLLKEPRIMDRLPELAKLSRERNFAEKIDQAFQRARLSFSHSEEEQVYFDRIEQFDSSDKKKRLREEVSKLSAAYEAWCQAAQVWDLPLLIRFVIERLREGWPKHLEGTVQPSEIVFLSQAAPESLEKHLREALSQWVQVREISDLNCLFDSASDQVAFQEPSREPSQATSQETGLKIDLWHTLEDAAYAIQERLMSSELTEIAVLIPDQPQVRRSLLRAIAQARIPLADPRDPTLIRTQEVFKTLLLPLQVVAHRYERTQVAAWISQYGPKEKRSQWLSSLASSGVRRSLESYKQFDPEFWQSVQALETSLGGRKTCGALKEAWSATLSASLSTLKGQDEIRFGMDLIGSVWDQILNDLRTVGEESKTAYPRVWLESLKSCLNEASPPAERNKLSPGVQLYRMTQAPTRKFKEVWLFGLPHTLLEPHFGDLWLTDRDRRLLAREFEVTSSLQKSDATLEALKKWKAAAEEWTVYDAVYDVDGRERGSIDPILKLVFPGNSSDGSSEAPGETAPEKSRVDSAKRFAGAHRALEKRWGSGGRPPLHKPRGPRFIVLTEVQSAIGSKIKSEGAGRRISATTLDRMSRCPFQALALHRWNLRDQREPNVELWPDSRGNLLHDAARTLIGSRNTSGAFGVTPENALEQAWSRRRPPGLLKAHRVESYVKRRMLPILSTFCEKEEEFFKRAGVSVTPRMLDDTKVEWTTLDELGRPIVIHGKPDRVEEHPDGLLVIDYKASGSIPNGIDMVNQGQRLQLPFYALALEAQYRRSVIGLLIVELDRKGGRKSGVLFEPWNSKEMGAVTQLRKGSKSLLVGMTPEEAWSTLKEFVRRDAIDYLKGRYRVCPKGEAARGRSNPECSRCMVADLCGLRRPETAGLETVGGQNE